MALSLVCPACGWINNFDSNYCLSCGANLDPNQGIEESNHPVLYKEVVYKRRNTDSINGVFKLPNSDEFEQGLYKIEPNTSPIIFIVLTVFPIFIFTLLFIYLLRLHSVYFDLTISFTLTAFLYVLILISSSHFIVIKSDSGRTIGKIKCKNLITNKNYIYSDSQSKKILAIEFISDHKANFFINEERYDISIHTTERFPFKIKDYNENIIFGMVNTNFEKYPKTLNIIFNKQFDLQFIVFLTSSIVDRYFIQKGKQQPELWLN